MSDKTEKPESETEAVEATEMPETEVAPEAEEEHRPAKQSSGSTLAFLATVIALGAGGGTFYLWQQQQALLIESRALEQRIERLLSVVEERHNSQLERIDALAEHSHLGTETQLGRIESVVEELRGRIGMEHREWAVAEVEYLLRVAEHRLNLEKDKRTALAVLYEARGLLASQDQAGFLPVLRQIDTDIGKLTAVTLPDRDRIAAELAALAATVEGLPIAIGEVGGTEAEPPVESAAPLQQSETNGWRQVLGMIWRDIKELVTIRHDGAVPRPLLEPEQHYFLKQNLQLKLEAARLALLAGNSRAYRDTLAEAGDWLQRFFNTSTTAVTDAQATIARLAAIELEPALPVIGRSRELLQQATRQRQSTRIPLPERAPSAAPTKKAAPAEEAEQATIPPREPDPEPSRATDEPATDAPALPQGNGS
jgi:uroporphyrin-3 C-methyltransferase